MKNKKIKGGDIVHYKDDGSRTPYLVLEDESRGHVVLGLEEYPDTEQDDYTAVDQLVKFEGKELKEATKTINKLLK